MFTLGQIALLILILLVIYDYILLFRKKAAVSCYRECSDRFSNGDLNEIRLHLESTYSFPIFLKIIDEVPVIFQLRDILFQLKMESRSKKVVVYTLRPVRRGVYKFGLSNIFVSSRLGLISRRFKTGQPSIVKVYPSYMYLQQYELMAISDKLTAPGLKQVRKIGQQLEPDQIRDYVKDDDYRTINWKATARRSKLMVNVFREERAQDVYCIIDKGRIMQSAFEKMTLLDYSINASLALAYVAGLKGDKAGLVTFEKQVDTLVPASRKSGRMQVLSEVLYNQTTTFAESDFSALYQAVNTGVKSRGLLLIFTNFDTIAAMKRQLRFLSILAKRHTVVVIFFENTELKEMIEMKPENKEETYRKVIAEKMIYEKGLIVNELRRYNIISILTSPNNLTARVINKYLEIKARGF